MPLMPVAGMWSIARPRPVGTQRNVSVGESVRKRNCIPAEWHFIPRTPPFTFVVTFRGSRS